MILGLFNKPSAPLLSKYKNPQSVYKQNELHTYAHIGQVYRNTISLYFCLSGKYSEKDAQNGTEKDREGKMADKTAEAVCKGFFIQHTLMNKWLEVLYMGFWEEHAH